MNANSIKCLTAAIVLGSAMQAIPGIASAQSRAAITQSIDEPGRNPYQETIFAECTGQFCNFNFSPIPAGKRLVLTAITGYIDTKNGAVPNGNVQSNFGGNQYATIFLVANRGTAGSNGTRFVVNQQVLAYFGPGETPHGFFGLVSTSDSFTLGGLLMLSGYFVTLP